MSGLRLALRGLWWRRGLSAAVLAVTALVVAIAVAGPTYDRAAKESVLQDALRSVPPSEVGLEATGSSTVAGVLDPVRAALASVGTDPFRAPITALEAPYTGTLDCSGTTPLPTSGCNAPVQGLVVARDGAFARLRLVAGRLPARPDEVAASPDFLRENDLRVGERVTPRAVATHLSPSAASAGVPPPPGFPALTIVGVWTTDEQDPAWFGRAYFSGSAPGGASARDARDAAEGDPYEDALFTVPATLGPLAATAVVDLPLDIHRVRVTDAARISRVVALVDAGAGPIASNGAGNFLSVSTQLPAVLSAAAANEHALGTPILLIVLQLVLLCGLVLLGAVRSAAEARGPEVALATLRRFPRRDVVLFGLAEPLLLMPMALAPGLLIGWLATKGLAAGQLLPDTPVILPADAVLAAVLAVVAAAVATVGIGVRILRRPPSAQWRRASQSAAFRPWWVDAVVVSAAAAGVAWLAASAGLSERGGHQGSAARPEALVAPALLALAVAMVGSRVLPALCRALYARTRRGGIGAFLAVRQVARRPTTLTATVLLTVALALATFAVAAAAVAGHNRHGVAATALGAATIVTVTPPPGVDLGQVVDVADPSGRSAMAVTEITSPHPDHRELIGVQPERLAAVAFWRSDFAGGRPLAEVARLLAVHDLHVVTVTGSELAVDTSSSGLRGAPTLRLAAAVVTPQGTVTLLGPALPATGTTRSVFALPDCAAGCRLSGLTIQRGEGNPSDLLGSVRFTALQQRTGNRAAWAPVPGALTGGASGWRATTADLGYASALSGASGTLDYRFDLPWEDAPSVAPYDVPASLPAAVSFPLASTAATSVGGLDEQELPITPVVVASVLPRAGADGALVDRTLAIRSAGNTVDAENEVWLAAGADPEILRRIAAAGVALGPSQSVSAATAALSRQGPPLALGLFRVGAVAAGVLALLGTALSLALAGRRRAFELSALHVQGVARPSLLRSLAAEQGLLLGFGSLLGVLTGLAGAVIALPSVPEFVTPPVAPPLEFGPPYLLVVALAAGLTALVAAGALLGAALLVRAVGADRLREYVP